MSKIKNLSNFIKFEPAQLVKGKVWYVVYRVEHPHTGKIVRIRKRCNRIKNLNDRKRYANEIIKDINNKLYNGWNPFIEKEVPKGYTYLSEAMNQFINMKTRELRPDSMRAYNSFIKTFTEWLKSADLEKCYCTNFERNNAREYMNHVYSNKECTARTFNNYRRFMLVLFNWMIEQQFVKFNPFTGIKTKKEAKKMRRPIPEPLRLEIQDYLLEHDYQFLMVLKFIYFTLLRPKEVTMLKAEFFNMKNQTIHLPGYVTKNGNDRLITIPDVFFNSLQEFNFNGATKNEYIFSKKLKPGTELIDARVLTHKWARMRKKLSIDSEYQMYSFRDTGIIEMLQNGISPEEVMRQADHSSLEITSIYAKWANPEGSQSVKSKMKKF